MGPQSARWIMLGGVVAALGVFALSGCGDDHGDHPHGEHRQGAQAAQAGGASDPPEAPRSGDADDSNAQAGHVHSRPAAARAAGAYPLAVCLVSGGKLGEMSPPVVIQHEGREVRFCCRDCVGTFRKEPAKYLAKLDAPPGERPAAGVESTGHDHAGHAH